MVTDHEVEQLMREVFGALPVPKWWVGVETGESLALWTFVEADELQPARRHALCILREMLEELAEVPCRIHVYEARPTRRQSDRAVKRIVRRW